MGMILESIADVGKTRGRGKNDKMESEKKGKRGLTPHDRTASHGEVQFFAHVGMGGGAVTFCEEAGAALDRTEKVDKNFIRELK